MSAGFFSVQGYSVNSISSSRTNLGPFSVPMSPNTVVQEMVLGSGTTTIPVPFGFAGGPLLGVAIIPPASTPAGVTMRYKTTLSDSGIYISTQQPTVIEWDTLNGNNPNPIYLVVNSGTITVTVQFL